MAKSKDAERQADIARQREEVRVIGEQFLAQLAPGSQEANQLQSEIQRLMATVESPASEQDIIRQLGQQLVSQQGARIAAGGPATPLEARTQAAVGGLRERAAFTPEEQDVLSLQRGQPTTTPTGAIFGERFQFTPEQQAILNALRGIDPTTPTGRILTDLVARAQRPEEFFQSTLQPQLHLAEEANRQAFARRGLLRSGLEQEGATRAGNELAIREAQAREAFRRNALSDFQSLLTQGRGIPGERQEGVEELFNVGQGLRQREIGVEEALVQMQLGRETDLTKLLAAQSEAGAGRISSLLERRTTRQESLSDLARQEDAARNAAIGRTVGNIAAIGANFIPGIGPVLSAGIKAGTEGFFGEKSSVSPSDAASLLGQSRSQVTESPRELAGTLSRNPQQLGQLDPQTLAALLKALELSGGA